MSAIEVLVDEFPGNDEWLRFVQVFRPSWQHVCDQRWLSEEIGNEEIAIVLNAQMGNDALAWMKQSIGALGNRSAHDILHNHSSGELAIKALIMRMPM